MYPHQERRQLTAVELDQVLTWSLVRAARLAGQRMADRLEPHDLNPVHFGVLAHLAITPDMTQAELSRAVLVRPQSIAPLLNGLEKRGLIRRTGGRVRGRRNPVQITSAGRAALDAVWIVVESTNDFSDIGLSVPESAELNRLLLKMVSTSRGSPTDGLG